MSVLSFCRTAALWGALAAASGCKGPSGLAWWQRPGGDDEQRLAQTDPNPEPASRPDTGAAAGQGEAAEYSLAAAEVAETPAESASVQYRFDADGDEPTSFVRPASARVSAPSTLVTLNKGQALNQVLGDASGPVLVDFYADWCGPCKVQGKILDELIASGEGSPLHVVKINFDEHPQLAKQMGVKRLPTLLVLDQGEVVKRQTGAMSKDDLLQWVAE